MKLNLKRVLAVIKKEFSQIRRDKRTIAIIIMIITAPVRRTIITIMIITTAGITGRTGRVPSPARIT